MYGLVLTMVLMQAAPSQERVPPAVLFVEQERALPGRRGQGLGPRVSALLERERLSLVVASEQAAPCRGQHLCLAKLGHTLGAALVVHLEAEALEDTLGLHLEAVSTSEGDVLLETVFVIDSGEREALEGEVSRFARRVHALLEPPESGEPPLDAPLVHRPLSPASSPPLPSAGLAVEKARRSRTLAYATGGGALVAAGAALTFGFVGLSAKARLDGPASLPRSEATRLVQRANLSFTLALSSALLSAALGTVSARAWQPGAPVPPRKSP